MKVFNNVTDIVRNDMASTMKKGSKVAIAAACFSMYAYNELKKQLENVDELRFIFTSPTFVTEKASKQKREDSELVKKIPYILKMAKNLKKLSVSRYYFDWEELVVLDMEKLEYLNVSIKQIYYASRLCLPNLKTLKLFYSEDSSVKEALGKYEEHMDYSGLNNLNRLELYYMSDISPDDFSDVATLEYLRLTYNYGSNLE